MVFSKKKNDLGSDVESSIVSDPGIGSSVPSPPGTVGNNSGQASDYEGTVPSNLYTVKLGYNIHPRDRT